MKAQILLLLGLIGVSTAFIDSFRADSWDDLKVTWGVGHFDRVPRTEADAKKEGFTMSGGCSDLPTHRGIRYMKDGDDALVLLFDKNGYIAGIQTVIPNDLPMGYPAKGDVPPFVKVGDKFYLTAYFIDPATICTKGRTADEFKAQGTGQFVVIQNGENPEKDYMPLPLKETALADTKWVKGKCFYSMGLHYWYDISKDMNCDSFFPVFLLYNNGVLNGFGWAVEGNLKSSRLEHPPQALFKLFMQEPPTCLADRGTLSTMHIFLTSTPSLNFC